MDGGAACSMGAAARRLVLWCARPAALEALGASVGVVLRGRDLTAMMLRMRGGGVRFGRSTPTTGCPSRGARLQRARRQGEPGSWALEPRARLLLGEIVRGWGGAVCLLALRAVLRSAGLEFDLGPRAAMDRSQEAPGDFGPPGCSHNGV